jgi:lysophospholipase L1-like esterase
MREFLNSGLPFKVKLMGDSIMHGAGGTGRADNGDLIPGTTFKMNPNGYCMANSLRDLLQGKYNAQVVNYAQSGTNSSIMYDQRNTLIEDDDDILIMQIGTNDRANLASTDVLKQHQRGIIEAAYAKGVKVILMSACPATLEGDNDPIRNFGMFDVDKAIRELANEYNMEHISNYDAFLEYAEFRNINMDTLLADGLHPNDSGYDVMFHNVVRNLGTSYRRAGIAK